MTGIAMVAIAMAVWGCGAGGRVPDPSASAPRSATAPAAVSVSVDAPHYRPGAVIAVTVLNAAPVPVFTEDQKTDCTVVILQRRVGSGWSDLSTCGSERASRTVRIGPGESHRASIFTASSNFADQPVVPGDYRVVLAFRWDGRPEGGEAARTASGTFTIG